MADLRETQQAFMDYILTDAALGTEGRNAGKNDKTDTFHSLVADQVGIASDIRMQIYSNAYRARLWETIETDHEILGLYLGDDLFEKMVDGYVAQHRSVFRSLRGFCEALPEFLATDDFFREHPVLSHIASFERCLLNAFDAEESDRADFQALQALPPEEWGDVTFRFHSSLQIFRCDSNAVESWQALKKGESPPAPDYSGERIWLLWRGVERLTEFMSISPAQLALLEGFIHGKSIADQCELMLGWYSPEDAPGQVFSALQAWFTMGIIRDVIAGSSETFTSVAE